LIWSLSKTRSVDQPKQRLCRSDGDNLEIFANARDNRKNPPFHARRPV